MSGSAEGLSAGEDDPLNVFDSKQLGSFHLFTLERSSRAMALWAFWSVFLLSRATFHLQFGAQADITVHRSVDRFDHLDVDQLEVRFAKNTAGIKGGEVLNRFQTEAAATLKPSSALEENQTVRRNKTQVEANYSNELQMPGPGENKPPERTVPVRGEKMKRSVRASHDDNVDRSLSGEAQSPERSVETSVQGASKSRTEHRRAGEEARGSSPRQSEPHLDTSTFALSGDSAHNQAMVHWSGHNSSVSLELYTNTH